MDCEVCNASGRISCGACWNGQRKALCPECSGRGWIRGTKSEAKSGPKSAIDAENGNEQESCPRCQGQGRITPPVCPQCSNSLVCTRCGGSGQN